LQVFAFFAEAVCLCHSPWFRGNLKKELPKNQKGTPSFANFEQKILDFSNFDYKIKGNGLNAVQRQSSEIFQNSKFKNHNALHRWIGFLLSFDMSMNLTLYLCSVHLRSFLIE